ncbi:MAG: methyltransferase domain-containing protein [bacterium]
MPRPLTPPDTLSRLLGAVDGGRVLDVATRRGDFIGLLAASLRSHAGFAGIDTDSEALAEARRAHPDAQFERADAASLPFPDADFDTVAIANSLHHLPDLPAAFREMKRVLRPGGAFVVREMYRDGQDEARLTHVLAHDWWAEVNTRSGESHRPSYTRAEVLALVVGLGLADLATDDLVPGGDPLDPESIEVFARRNREVLRKLRGAADYAAHEARCEALIARARAVGILSPAAVIAVGRNPV